MVLSASLNSLLSSRLSVRGVLASPLQIIKFLPHALRWHSCGSTVCLAAVWAWYLSDYLASDLLSSDFTGMSFPPDSEVMLLLHSDYIERVTWPSDLQPCSLPFAES